MLPTKINQFLQRDVIGQEESLRFVAVAIFKHLKGEPFGNLMLIGSSGTGKTTIMRAVERIYEEHDELQKYRVVVILNANTFASDEGVVDTARLFRRLEEQALDLDPEERLEEDQVPRARDRKELGQPLNQTEPECLEGAHRPPATGAVSPRTMRSGRRKRSRAT